MFSINYDVTIDEIKTAFMLRWRKYSIRRTIMFSLVFLIATVLFVNMMFDGEVRTMIGGVGAGLAMGFMINLWLKPRRILKRLITALEMLGDEKYTAMFGDTTIEIETVQKVEDEEAIEKTVYRLGEEEFFSKETSDLFLLFVNRALIHVFPKRCLSEQEVEKLREYFILKKI